MKKILFTNAFKLSISTCLLILAIASCTKKSAELKLASSTDEIASAKPGSVPEVLLKMTVNDAVGNNITSDGGGDYVTGNQGTSIKFDQWGNLILNAGKTGRGNNQVQVRWLNVNFSDSIVVYIPPPITGNDKITDMVTGSTPGFTIPLQNLTIGQSECVRFGGGSGNNWNVHFHGDLDGSLSAYAVFTRINATQWTVTPAGSCSPYSNVCEVRAAGTLYGYWNMPFSFTLTKL